jgi:transcriptional regulator NrdR family protein
LKKKVHGTELTEGKSINLYDPNNVEIKTENKNPSITNNIRKLEKKKKISDEKIQKLVSHLKSEIEQTNPEDVKKNKKLEVKLPMLPSFKELMQNLQLEKKK